MGIFDRFRRKPPKPGPLRGTAGRRTPEERYIELTPSEAQGFLDGDYLIVHSSCIVGVQYLREAREFMVEWKDEATGKVEPYWYIDVPESVARAFLAAGSKGSFCSLTFAHGKWRFHR